MEYSAEFLVFKLFGGGVPGNFTTIRPIHPTFEKVGFLLCKNARRSIASFDYFQPKNAGPPYPTNSFICNITFLFSSHNTFFREGPHSNLLSALWGAYR